MWIFWCHSFRHSEVAQLHFTAQIIIIITCWSCNDSRISVSNIYKHLASILFSINGICIQKCIWRNVVLTEWIAGFIGYFRNLKVDHKNAMMKTSVNHQLHKHTIQYHLAHLKLRNHTRNCWKSFKLTISSNIFVTLIPWMLLVYVYGQICFDV